MQHYNTDGENNDIEGQSLDQLIEKAVDAAAKGENIEQLLEVILSSLTGSAKEKARKSFIAALAKRGLRAPAGDADIPSRATLSRIRTALAVSTRQMMERINQLVRSRPEIAAMIKQAGTMLVRNGVVDEKVQVSEADLGTMSPKAVVGKAQQDQGASRG